jgi:predicted permease
MLTLSDLRLAVRLMLRSPGFTLLTVLVLAGGLAVSLFTFGALNTIVYGDLPVADGGTVRRIGVGRWPNFEPLDAYELSALRAEADDLRAIGAYRSTRSLIGDTALALNARAIEADWGIFDFTGTPPLLGRGFVQRDSAEGAEPVAVLGHELWQSAFAADPDVVGRLVRINGKSTRIVGVMPDGYRFPQNAELWLPLHQSLLSPSAPTGESLNAYARVRADVPITAIEAEATTIVQRVRGEYSRNDESVREPVSVLTFQAVSFGVFGNVVFGVLNLLALSVLLIAAVNVGNLLLARTNRRIREIGVRVALGAPRARLIAQIVLENVLLCALSSAMAIWLAGRGLMATNAFMRSLLGSDMPFWWVWGLDRGTLTVAGLVVAVTVFVVTVLPALSVSRADPNLLLREGSRGGGLATGRVSRALVTLQVALIAALLLVGSVATVIAGRVASFDLGMDIDNVLMMNVESPEGSSEERLAAYERVLDAVRAAPEVEAAAILMEAPGARFSVDGTEYPTVDDYPGAWRVVLSDRPTRIGPTLIEGRAFDNRDTSTSQRTAIVSQSLARAYWPNESPIGHTIDLLADEGRRERRMIVGVMANVTYDPIGVTPFGSLAIYFPQSQLVLSSTRIVARHRGNEAGARSAMYRAVERASPNLVPGEIHTYSEALEQITRFGRTITKLFAGAGAFAVLLAITGIYGMSANGVGLRRHEIGLRRALGATEGHVLRVFVVQGLRQLMVGLVLSALISVAVLGVVSQGFSLDGATLALIGLAVLIAVSGTVLLSIYLSVRGVLKLEPSSVLRFA